MLYIAYVILHASLIYIIYIYIHINTYYIALELQRLYGKHTFSQYSKHFKQRSSMLDERATDFPQHRRIPHLLAPHAHHFYENHCGDLSYVSYVCFQYLIQDQMPAMQS